MAIKRMGSKRCLFEDDLVSMIRLLIPEPYSHENKFVPDEHKPPTRLLKAQPQFRTVAVWK